MRLHPIHHRTWFPFVLVGLTFSLMLLVAWAYANKQDVAQSGGQEGVTQAITDEAYVAAASRVMSGFLARFDAAGSDTERLLLVEKTQSDLLALLVPGSRRGMHLELAVSLNLLRKGFEGDAVSLAEGRYRLQSVLEGEPWLR